MTEIKEELSSRLVIGRKQDGRCVYDPQVKDEIARRCLAPGISVSRVSMQLGVNANLLRAWIGKVQGKGAALAVKALPQGHSVGDVFTPIQISAPRSPAVREPAAAKLGLLVRFPNGVEFDVAGAAAQDLLPLLQMLGGLACSESTKR